MRVVVGESVKDPETSEAFMTKMLGPARLFIRECLDLWGEKGLLRDEVDTGVATVAFLGIIGYFMVEHAFFGTPELEGLDPEELSERFVSIFLEGVLKR